MNLFKSFSLFLALLIFSTAMGCSNPTKHNDSTEDTTDAVYESTSETELVLGNCEPIAYQFLSAADMHTYITTGSTDLADYSPKQIFPLYYYPPVENLQDKYIYIKDLFQLDSVALDAITYASFTYGRNNNVEFVYEVDTRAFISINCLPDSDAGDTLASEFNYFSVDGNICEVWLTYQNYKIIIKIYPIFNSDGSKDYSSAYDAFMTSPEFAAFSPYFSANSETRQQAFEGFKQSFAFAKNEMNT